MSTYLNSTLFIFISLLILLCSVATKAQCQWEYYNETTVMCVVKNIDATLGLDLSPAEGRSKLIIKCMESVYQESRLPRNVFSRLKSIKELKINECKLLELNDSIFFGLNSLQKLSINTKNLEWGVSKILNVHPYSMNGLKELEILDMSDSNIISLPENFLCPMTNLKVFNLTRNRIRSTNSLGLVNKTCTNALEIDTLDLSFNEIELIPENWGISKLRRLAHLYLQFNNISKLSGESFAGLHSLSVLNLSYNFLDTLPDNLLAGSRELHEIHLQGNQLYELPRGLFHRLEQLLVLDLSRNQLSSHHVDETTFAGLIRLVILNLAHNAVTRISAGTFKELYFLQILDLRNNSIGFIEEGTFLPVYNLHTLNLAENRLHTLNDRIFAGLFVLEKLTLNNNLINIIEPNVFKNCSDLKELDLSSNQLTDVPEALQDLSVLKTLDLGENQISTFANGSFRGLNQLTGLRLIDNQIENITVGMLNDLPRLSVLNVAKNKIQNIEHGAFDNNKNIEAIRLDNNYLSDINGIFATLPSLLWLNLAENHLTWFDYAFVPSNLKWLDIHGNYIEALGNYYKMQEQIKIKTLDASHNRMVEIGPMNIPNSVELIFINNNHINKINPNTFVDKINLARVDLYANALNKLQLHQLRIAPSPSHKALPEFYLGGNPFECDCTMEWLQRVNNMTSRQHPKIMDLSNIECIMPHARGEPIRAISKLEPKDFLCSYEKHCFALCHCCDFDACDCKQTCPHNCSCYHDQTWGTNIVDCGNQKTYNMPNRIPMDATEVYLDGNDFPLLEAQVFIGRKNLRALFVNASNVASIQNRTFSGLPSLELLHLEDNRIQKLHGYEFENLTHLKELYLHNNHITYIDNNTFGSLVSLEIIRIDGNRLTSLPYWQFQATFMRQLNSISLGRNNWSCRCRNLQELTSFVVDYAVIIQDSQDIFCVEGNVNRELDFNVTSVCSDFYAGSSVLHSALTNNYLSLLIIALVTICLLLLVVILFVFREPLRVWLFAHYGVRIFGPPCEESEKLYDVVLFHSAKDADFVVRSIGTELENGRPPVRLCLQHRDVASDAAYRQLLDTAQASRHIAIYLSRNFLQTEWSRIEFRRAFHESLRVRPNKLVVIEEPDVLLETEIDAELLPYLKIKTINRIRRTDRNFYEKLRYALPVQVQYRGNNYTIDHHEHHERIKQPISPGIMYRQAPPPAYCPEIDEANYSSATTATPSPRPNRRATIDAIHRPPSEHIYSSIDSDYSTLECENMMAGIHRPTWRNHNTMNHATNHIPPNGPPVQAYLV